jgi:hypothetical protein
MSSNERSSTPLLVDEHRAVRTTMRPKIALRVAV